MSPLLEQLIQDKSLAYTNGPSSELPRGTLPRDPNELLDKRILLRRSGALGDVLFVASVASTIRSQQKGCVIDLACPEWIMPLVRRISDINRVVSSGESRKEAIWSKYDFLVDFGGALERDERAKYVDYYKLHLEHAGADRWPLVFPQFSYPKGSKNYLAIHVGGSNAKKKWPLAHWEELLDGLDRRYISYVLLGDGGDDHPRCANSSSDLIGSTDLEDACKIVYGSALFVGTDSGLLHFAGMVGIPTFSLWGAFDPMLTLPNYRETSHVRSRVDCAPCLVLSAETCPYKFRCMAMITPENVLTKLSNHSRLYHAANKSNRVIQVPPPSPSRSSSTVDEKRFFAGRSVEHFPSVDTDVSVLVPNKGTAKFLPKLFSSLEDNTGDVRYEVVLCTDGDTPYLKSGGKEIVLSHSIGFAGANNRAYSVASDSSEFICLLNADIEVEPNWLLPLVEYMRNNPDAGIVGSKQLKFNGVIESLGSRWDWKSVHFPHIGYGKTSHPEQNTVCEREMITFSAVLIRRKLWEDVGGIDEAYAVGYWEDSVTADMPVVVRRGFDTLPEIVAIADLYSGTEDGRQAITDYDVWTRTGWQKLSYVYKHKVRKRILRLKTRTGLISVTGDHSVFQNGTPVCASTIGAGDTLDLVPVTSFPFEHVACGELKTRELGWCLGLFAAEGSVSYWEGLVKNRDSVYMVSRYNASLTMYDEKSIRKYADIMGWHVYEYTDARGVRYWRAGAVKTSDTWQIGLKELRDMFYTKEGLKRVPAFVLSGDPKLLEGFFEGFVLGDGHVEIRGRSTRIHMTTDSMPLALGLQVVLSGLGMKYSVNTRADKRAVNIRVRGLTTHRKSVDRGSDDCITGVDDVTSLYADADGMVDVYDVTTQSGDFVAGLGGVIAHNTDFCMKARQLGWKIYCVPQSVVKHHVGGSKSFVRGGRAHTKKIFVDRWVNTGLVDKYRHQMGVRHQDSPVVACYIVLNEEEYIQASLESIYDFVDRIVIVEGGNDFAVKAGWCDSSKRSTDYTVERIQEFPDPQGKIKLIQGSWATKVDQRNAYADLLEPGEWMLLMDGDEVFLESGLWRLSALMHSYDIIMPGFYLFWNNFHTLGTSVWNDFLQSKAVRWHKGFRYLNHNCPSDTSGKLIVRRDAYRKWRSSNERLYCHYSWVKPLEKLRVKAEYYRHQGGHPAVVKDYMNKVFLAWRQDPAGVEKMYGTHPYGAGETMEFPLRHPKSISRRMDAGEFDWDS